MSAMTTKRRQGPLRQLSLQSPQHMPARGPLRKQLSEDGGGWSDPDMTSLRVSASSIRAGSAGQHDKRHVVVGRTGGLNVRPRPVKVAWAEVKQSSQDQTAGANDEALITRKCAGQPRPTTAKPQRAHLPLIGDKDTILFSRQQLAERLRKVWQEREHSRSNIDIFLAHNTVDCDDENFPDSARSVQKRGEESTDVPTSNKTPVPVKNVCVPYVFSEKKPTPFTANISLRTTTNLSQNNSISNLSIEVSKPKQILASNVSKSVNSTVQNSPKQTIAKGFSEINNTVISTNKINNFEMLSPKNITPLFGPQHKELQQKTNVNFVNSLFSVSNSQTVPSVHKSPENEQNCRTNITLNITKTSSPDLEQVNKDESQNPNTSQTLKAGSEGTPEDNGAPLVESLKPREELFVEATLRMDTSLPDSRSHSLSSQSSISSDSDMPENESTNQISIEPVTRVKPEIMDAHTRRVNFRNSINKAVSGSFNSSSPPPPLCRTLSAPPQKLPPQTKGILVKKPLLQTTHSVDYDSPPQRNVRSAPLRARLKSSQRRGMSRDSGDSDDDDDEEEEPEKEKPAPKGRKSHGRSAEVVTMVSLMSPSGSDAEEEPQNPPFLTEPIAPWLEEKSDTGDTDHKSQPVTSSVTVLPPRILCLRKTPKSVSFQHQPHLAGGRTYTTYFPSRRGSLAAVAAANPPQPQPAPTEKDKRPQGTEPLGAKRRLGRPKQYSEQDQPEESSASVETVVATEEVRPIEVETPRDPPMRCEISATAAPPVAASDTPAPQPPEGASESEEPTFQSSKEKECWRLYRKMAEKGVAVSYDTVLRGMLTPTEYRLRKKALQNICAVPVNSASVREQ